jgi:hypothetical protein
MKKQSKTNPVSYLTINVEVEVGVDTAVGHFSRSVEVELFGHILN